MKIFKILAVVIVAVATYIILKFCDIAALRETIGDNFFFWAIIALLQIVQTVFVPVSNQLITVPLLALFPDSLLYVFLSSFSGIFIGSIILYLIGYRFELIKNEKFLNFMKKYEFFYPTAMLIPFIPDDIISTLAGTAKYHPVYVIIVTFITRAICVAASVWGFGYLTRFWWGWVILVSAFLLLIGATFILWRIIDR